MAEAVYVPLHFNKLSSEAQLVRSRDFLPAMQTRRTVRHFSTETPPHEWIENAIATATTPPSGAHQRPWRFVVVRDPAVKHAIREAADQKERENYERRFPEEWKDALARLGTDWHKDFLDEAPYLIVVFAEEYGLLPGNGPEEPERKIKHYYVKESVGIAVGLLIASLHQAGLAMVTHTPNPMGFLAELLERPPNEKAMLVMPVGYPARDARVPDLARKPLDAVAVWR